MDHQPDRIRLDTIRPNARNPRKIGADQLARLKASIQRDPQFMELRPIIVDADGMILGGNMRYRACKALGMADVPASWVRRAADLTEDQRRRFIVADNAPAGMAGEWDMEILAADWTMPELEELGMGVMPADSDVPDSNQQIDEEAMKDTEHECPKCGFKW